MATVRREWIYKDVVVFPAPWHGYHMGIRWEARTPDAGLLKADTKDGMRDLITRYRRDGPRGVGVYRRRSTAAPKRGGHWRSRSAIAVGEPVEVTSGPYRGAFGLIEEREPEGVVVRMPSVGRKAFVGFSAIRPLHDRRPAHAGHLRTKRTAAATRRAGKR